MIDEPTSLATISHALARGLRVDYGIDPEPLFHRAGIRFDTALPPGTRYPESRMHALWTLALDATGDPAVGLKTGWHVRPELFYALGFSWLASDSLLDGMRRLCRYHKVLSTRSRTLRIDADEDAYVLSRVFDVTTRKPLDVVLDAGITALLELCRIVADENVRPIRVDLQRDKPRFGAIYARTLSVPVRFSQPKDALYFDRERMEAPLAGRAAEIARATDRVAEDYLQSIEPSGVAAAVQRLLVKLLPSGRASQDAIARHLHRSTSSLQRQLRNEGSSFADILTSTRRRLAEDYLRQGKYSLADIAFLLGYADPSSFSRAFRRWTSMTPGQFQAR